jgi:hypothetical protein
MAMKSIVCSIIILLAIGQVGEVKAQIPIKIDQKTPYYIDVTNVEKSSVFDIQEGALSIQYHDRIGQTKQIPLTIYSWKLETIGSFNLDKTFGINNYTIDLNQKLSGLEDNTIYFCILLDEQGNKHEWSFRNIPTVKSEDLNVDIIINPKRLTCSEGSGNLVEFYGKISEGKPPYSIRWYVMNEGKSDFLYQPKEDIINSSGKTAVIQVDKTPAYYVVMDVTDACGTNTKKMVYLNCRKDKKKISTIFVEPKQRSRHPKSISPSR